MILFLLSLMNNENLQKQRPLSRVFGYRRIDQVFAVAMCRRLARMFFHDDFRSLRVSIRLFLLQLIPLVVDEFEKHIVYLLWTDECKFTIPERPGFLSSRSGNKRVAVRLQLF